MSRPIYEKNLGYSLLRPIINFFTWQSYRKVEVKGEENLPKDGAMIIAPNHCNTLMDALVVLRSSKKTTVFGARADMFNNPLIAKIMHFIRILPMVRQRDGLRNVLKNHETTDIIVEVLEHDTRFCMYPEGRHRAAHSLLTLGKGVFRTALAANNKFGEKMPVYIVPTGIEYGDYFRYRSTCLVTYGNPINVTEFIKGLDVENEAQMMDPLRKELSQRMSELITYIKDDEDMGAKWELTKLLARVKKATSCSLTDKMLRNRAIVASIERFCEKDPEAASALLDKTRKFEKKRRRSGVSVYSLGRKNHLLNILGKTAAALIGLPYFIFSAIATLPKWGIFTLLKKVIKDKAFRNTAGFGVNLVVGLIMFITLCICLFNCFSWPLASGMLLLYLPAYAYFNDYLEFMRRYISDIRYSGNRELMKDFNEILKLAKDI